MPTAFRAQIRPAPVKWPYGCFRLPLARPMIFAAAMLAITDKVSIGQSNQAMPLSAVSPGSGGETVPQTEDRPSNPATTETASSPASQAALAVKLADRLDKAKEDFAHNQMNINRRYQRLYVQMKLSDSEQDALTDKLVDRMMLNKAMFGPLLSKYSYKVEVAMPDGGTGTTIGTYGSEALLKVADHIQEPVENEIKALLGAERYGQFHRYDQDVGYYSEVGMVNQRVSMKDSLTDQQIESLVSLMDQAHPSGPPMYSWSNITPEVLDKAGEFLTPPQLEALVNRAAQNATIATAAKTKETALLKSGWKGNPSKEPLLTPDPFN